MIERVAPDHPREQQDDFDGDDDSEFEAGYNLLVGINARPVFDTRARPFAEARWSGVDDYHPFRLVAGVNVPIN